MPLLDDPYPALDLLFQRLDIVAFDGASFIARRDDPGLCPGDGWQLIAAYGARGEKGLLGPRGERGDMGECGEPAPRIVAWLIDRERGAPGSSRAPIRVDRPARR